jgi:hypothetical protein
MIDLGLTGTDHSDVGACEGTCHAVHAAIRSSFYLRSFPIRDRMQTFLEFEKPIQHLIEQIEKLKEVAAAEVPWTWNPR